MNDVVITNSNGVVDVQISEKVALAIRTLEQIQIQLQEMKNVEEEIKDLFGDAMDKAGVKALDFDGIHITRVGAHNTTRLDSKKFKADHPDMFEQYSVTTVVKPSTRISYE